MMWVAQLTNRTSPGDGMGFVPQDEKGIKARDIFLVKKIDTATS